jgi:hypothetical protein
MPNAENRKPKVTPTKKRREHPKNHVLGITLYEQFLRELAYFVTYNQSGYLDNTDKLSITDLFTPQITSPHKKPMWNTYFEKDKLCYLRHNRIDIRFSKTHLEKLLHFYYHIEKSHKGIRFTRREEIDLWAISQSSNMISTFYELLIKDLAHENAKYLMHVEFLYLFGTQPQKSDAQMSLRLASFKFFPS